MGLGSQKNVSLSKGVLSVSEVPSGGGTDTVRVRLPFLPSVTIETGVIYTVKFVCEWWQQGLGTLSRACIGERTLRILGRRGASLT